MSEIIHKVCVTLFSQCILDFDRVTNCCLYFSLQWNRLSVIPQWHCCSEMKAPRRASASWVVWVWRWCAMASTVDLISTDVSSIPLCHARRRRSDGSSFSNGLTTTSHLARTEDLRICHQYPAAILFKDPQTGLLPCVSELDLADGRHGARSPAPALLNR